MKYLILAITLTLSCPALAQTIDIAHYKPQSPVAAAAWSTLTDYGKTEIYQTEHRRYFNPHDKETNLEILSIVAFDSALQEDRQLALSMDEQSYKNGFLDCYKTMRDNTSQKKSIPWGKIARHIAQSISNTCYLTSMQGAAMANNPLPAPPPIAPMQLPTYIRRISLPNSPFPAYQVSNF